MFKKIFGSGSKEDQRDYTIDELIILERYDEAVLKLKAKMKVKDELHDHLKLADCYAQLREINAAIDEYVYVGEEFARDGFFEKAIALLNRAQKIAPLDETLPQKIERIEQMRRLEQSRAMAVEGLTKRRAAHVDTVTPSVVEFQALWSVVSKTPLIRRLGGEQLRLLFASVEIRYTEVEDLVTARGKIDETLFIVAKGLLAANAADGYELRRFGPGDIFNESGLFERKASPADITVLERGAVLALNRAGLEACLTGNPDPRTFLALLRDQDTDRALSTMLHKSGKL